MVIYGIGTIAFITLHFTRQPWSQWFDAEWFWCLIDRMEKFVIPLRFEFVCISFGSLGQNSLVLPLPNVNQTTLHCNYIYTTNDKQLNIIPSHFPMSIKLHHIYIMIDHWRLKYTEVQSQSPTLSNNLNILKGEVRRFFYWLKIFVGPKLSTGLQWESTNSVLGATVGIHFLQIRPPTYCGNPSILSSELLWESTNSVLRATVGIHCIFNTPSHLQCQILIWFLFGQISRGENINWHKISFSFASAHLES